MEPSSCGHGPLEPQSALVSTSRHEPIDGLAHNFSDGHASATRLRPEAAHLVFGQRDLSSDHVLDVITKDAVITRRPPFRRKMLLPPHA